MHSIKNIKKSKQKKLDSNLSESIHYLFSNEKLWKLSLKIIFPALMVSLLFGIFIFADQIIVQNIAPFDGNKYFQLMENQMGANWNNALIAVYGTNNVETFKINQDLIRSAITYSSTISLVILSLGLFINTGSSIIYSKSFATSDNFSKSKIVSNGFYGSLISGFIFMLIIIGIQNLVINSMLPNPTLTAIDSTNNLFNPNTALTNEQQVLISTNNFDQIKQILTGFYSSRNDVILNLSNQYIYFLSASIPFVSIINLWMFLLRVEGKNLWITLFSIGASFLNILFDFVFLYYAKLGMLGSGLATLLGYLINLISIVVYLYFLNLKNLTDIKYTYLRKFELNWEILFISFVLGSGTFLRDLSLAIANILYLPVWTSTISSTGSANILIDIGGVSAAPIYNLFFFAIFGIIDGLRPILSYNYMSQNYKRVKQAFYNAIYLSLIYAIIVNIIIYIPTYVPKDNNQFLIFLGAGNSNGTIIPIRQEILYILIPSMMLQLPFLSLTISGLCLFQSTGKMWLNIICSIIQGIITFFPILYIVSWIAILLHSWQLMIYCGFINIVISSIVIFIISLIYLHIYMGKKEKYSNPNEAINNIRKKLFKK